MFLMVLTIVLTLIFMGIIIAGAVLMVEGRVLPEKKEPNNPNQ